MHSQPRKFVLGAQTQKGAKHTRSLKRVIEYETKHTVG
ncbi:hypothetical protein BFV94_4572 [Alteromonas macleodii]|uniref:Uncharacterized protein n=1 Tax=Alteromonas macleodii TaxID=28108 RepID=A0AB36FL40_ALTMA|nr:hypothetical protein BFV93_4790 [Alteromonas macleodii]OES24823.1 hypothetical protein BFV95_4582 [Alteromonas macleodii]OES25101.1 hypothetical protein BFV94_4572 [Alteromonas macleodii]OES39144.1 hypothetical protein BFV96_4292 [Alteromonas macleodii]